MNENEGLGMTGRQLARLLTMIIISILLIASVFGYGCEIGPVKSENLTSTKYVSGDDKVNIDGADFTVIVNVMLFGTKGFLGFIIAITYCIGMFITAMFLLLPWRLIAIRKKSVIAPEEMKAAATAYISVSVLSLLLGFAGAGFSSLFSILALTLVVVAMFGGLCYFPYRSAYRRCNKDRNTDFVV